MTALARGLLRSALPVLLLFMLAGAAALAAVAVLAVAVNFFALLCTAGLPAMYTAIMTSAT